MKNWIRKAAALTAVVITAVCMAGCSPLDAVKDLINGKFDASGYVKSVLDCTYLGQYEDYMEFTKATETEAADAYNTGIEVEYGVFLNYFGIETEDEAVKNRIINFYKSVYAKSKYEVKDASSTEEGYAVPVVIYPIDVFQNIDDKLSAFATDLAQGYQDGEYDELSDEEFEVVYATGIIDICEAAADNCGYGSPVELLVQVKPDEDGVYWISDTDFQSMDNYIIDYTSE